MKRKSKMDVEYERGFAAGHRKGLKTTIDAKALRDRFNYLKLGGSWDMLTTDARETYLAGFEDAMKTLGVKP